jgi:hypothetical protein
MFSFDAPNELSTAYRFVSVPVFGVPLAKRLRVPVTPTSYGWSDETSKPNVVH